MSAAILIINAGSTSIKFSVFPGGGEPSRKDILCDGECEGIGNSPHITAKNATGKSLLDQSLPTGTTHEAALAAILHWFETQFKDHQLVSAGHRVVHGGTRYTAPVRLDDAVMTELRRLIPMVPFHQPHNLAAITELAKLHPALPQVACFDTSFHHTQPQVASTFALPRNLTDEGIRRYGFHGISYEYIASVLPDMIGAEKADGRVVVAHLGGGASMCAMHQRKSVATTMSFTALDGLPMSSRCGSLDPGVALYLIQEKNMTVQAVSDLLYKSSGLLGVSGISDDMRTLLQSDDPHAAEAVNLFAYQISRELGSLAAALGGLDALVFTAGIGEHAPEIRRRVCAQAAWLGIKFDKAANDAANNSGGTRITTASSTASAWVIPTDEDLMIARHTWNLTQNNKTQKSQQRNGKAA